MKKSAAARDVTNQLAVVRSRLFVIMSQITTAFPATAIIVGNQPIIQNHLCMFCTLPLLPDWSSML